MWWWLNERLSSSYIYNYLSIYLYICISSELRRGHNPSPHFVRCSDVCQFWVLLLRVSLCVFLLTTNYTTRVRAHEGGGYIKDTKARGDQKQVCAHFTFIKAHKTHPQIFLDSHFLTLLCMTNGGVWLTIGMRETGGHRLFSVIIEATVSSFGLEFHFVVYEARVIIWLSNQSIECFGFFTPLRINLVTRKRRTWHQ